MNRQTAGLVGFAVLLLGSLTALAFSIVPAERGAVVSVLTGSASSPSGSVLSPSASLSTAPGSITAVSFPGGIVTRLDGGSELRVLRLHPSVDTELRSGGAWTMAAAPGTIFSQRLPGGVLVSTQGGQLQTAIGSSIGVIVWSGTAQLEAGGKRRDLDAGSHAVATGGDVRVAPVSDPDRSLEFTTLNRTLDAVQGARSWFAAGKVAANSDSASQDVLLADGTTNLTLTIGASTPDVEVTLTDPTGNAFPARAGIVVPLSLVVPAVGAGLWSYRVHNPGDRPMNWWVVASWRLQPYVPGIAASAVKTVDGSRASAISARSPAGLTSVEVGVPLQADQAETQLGIASQNYTYALPFRRFPLGLGFPTADRPVHSSLYWPDSRAQRFLVVSLMDSGRHELRLLAAPSAGGPWKSDFAVSLQPDSPDPIFASTPDGSPRSLPKPRAADPTAALLDALQAEARDQPAPGVLPDSWSQNLLQRPRASVDYLRAIGFQESISYSAEKAPGDVVFLADGRPLAFSALRETSTVTSGGSACVDNPIRPDPTDPHSWNFFNGLPPGRFRSITRVNLIQVAAVLPTPAVPALQILGYDSSTIAISATPC